MARTPDELNNLAISLTRKGNWGQAIEFFQKALKADGQYKTAKLNLAVLYNNLAVSFLEKGDLRQAFPFLYRSIRYNPEFSLAYSNLIEALLNLNEWAEINNLGEKMDMLVDGELKSNKKAGETPFLDIVRHADPKRNYLVAKSWSDSISPVTQFKFNQTSLSSSKIKVGYLSDGFRDFPTAYNIYGVVNSHNRKQFEVYLYSLGKYDTSKIGQRIKKAADQFIDLSKLTDEEAAQKIYQDKIDILVDLKGHTRGKRMEIIALKPAPVVISLLFTGTTGSKFHDYFIADKTMVTKNEQKYFSEKIIYLPDTYWPAYAPDDNTLQNKPASKKRKSFIFCSFASNYKITPLEANLWTKILKKVPSGILWLWERSKLARENLTGEFVKRGIKANRLVFFKHLPKNMHLARLNKADLALDTISVNGHTTTTDALWAGVGVITVLGNHFASRVSASMLKAIGLPQLITKNLKEYEDLAVELATNPKKLEAIHKSLIINHKSSPLFDTQKYTRNLEKAFLNAFEIYKKGSEPKDIYI